MSLVLQSSGGGQVSLEEPVTASNFTQTLPAATGTVMVSGNMPAFSAYASAAQTVTNNVFTKVTFGTEEFDTNSNFASSTFTPTVAGYYQVNFLLAGSGTTTLTRLVGSIYKNGSSIGRDFDVTVSAGTNPVSGSGARVIYMNGTTDYLEVYALVTGTGTLSVSGNAVTNTSYFSACLLRGA